MLLFESRRQAENPENWSAADRTMAAPEVCDAARNFSSSDVFPDSGYRSFGEALDHPDELSSIEAQPLSSWLTTDSFSVASLDSDNASSSAMPAPVVALDGASARWPALRKGIDRLGYASAVFNSLSDLMCSLQAGRHFGLLFLTFPSTADIHWLRLICELTDAPMLLVVDVGDIDLLRQIGGEHSHRNELDFVLTPFGAEEISSRVQFLLNRSAAAALNAKKNGPMVFRDYLFQLDKRRVFYKGQEINLQPREYNVAVEFFRNRDRLVTRQTLHALFWRNSTNLRSRTIDVCVSKVRRKLNIDPKNGLILRTISGRGYQLHTAIEGEGG